MPRREGSDLSYDAEGNLRWGRRAAGLLIRRVDTGMFLLVMRSQDVMDPGVLGIPGGRVEEGEDALQGAIAESTEELGPLPPFAIMDQDVYRSGEFTYTTFLAHMGGKAASQWRPELNWENDAWVWVDPNDSEFLRLSHEDVHPNVRRVIGKWV